MGSALQMEFFRKGIEGGAGPEISNLLPANPSCDEQNDRDDE
jgi:hypothetical protein